MEVADNTTILSVEQTGIVANRSIVLLTVLTPTGGSEELTEQVFSRLNKTAGELGIEVFGPVVRFGEFMYTA